MKTLDLILKTKWFEMIESGEKKEEYREIKKHWAQRLVFCQGQKANPQFVADGLLKHDTAKFMFYNGLWFWHFDQVRFSLGYAKNRRQMILPCYGISIGLPKPEWSEDSTKPCFIIKLAP